MALAKTYSAQVTLLSGTIITVETDLGKGLYQFSVVGLPDKAVEESRDRVSAAIKNSGFKSPKNKNQKVVISLSPADIKKEGSYFDLPIALSYLLACGDITFNQEGKIFLGELALSGKIRPVRGALPITRAAARAGFKEIYLPEENAKEAALVDGISVYGVKNLKEVVAHLVSADEKNKVAPQPKTKIEIKDGSAVVDFSDIKGQEFAKHGLMIAAAGGHNAGMYGPPGTGKTLLARAFSGILPTLEREDVFEVTSIHSVAGILEDDLITTPPFRAPHHTSSYVSLVGGGSSPRPGEITLAHRGVLFLDEFPEFDKRVIESLRQPLEDGHIQVSRAKGSATFPARFILIAAMNPCPCGFYGTDIKRCICRPIDIAKYKRKLSGPIVDRIDMWLSVESVDYEKLGDSKREGLSNKEMKKKVSLARERGRKRFAEAGRKIGSNSEMNIRDLISIIKLSPKVKKTLEDAATRLKLSARAYHKTIKLARTIADLASHDEIEVGDILEAFQYRPRSSD